MDGADGFTGVGIAFQVEGDHVGAGLCKCVRIPERVGDHQVDVEWEGGRLSDGGQDRDAEGDVGDKDPVHYVKVDHVGAGVLHARQLAAQAGKICRQDRGGNTGFTQ